MDINYLLIWMALLGGLFKFWDVVMSIIIWVLRKILLPQPKVFKLTEDEVKAFPTPKQDEAQTIWVAKMIYKYMHITPKTINATLDKEKRTLTVRDVK
jgi:hypothetical protein